MIISVHIPKTAGTSFRKALEKSYGPSLLLDYNHQRIFDFLLSRGYSLDSIHREWLKYYKITSLYRRIILKEKPPNNIEIIHGHFPANKYYADYLLNKAKFITWIREPFERMISNYYFWKQVSNDTPDLFVRKIFYENWSIEDYCFCVTFKDYQSLFIGSFPITGFAFIGTVENYEADIDYLSKKILGRELSALYENKTSYINENIYHVLNDRILRSRFKNFHQKDYDLYEYVINMNKKRKYF